MNGIQITIFILVALSAIPLLNWAWKRGEQQKSDFEKNAIESLENDLMLKGVDHKKYKIFFYDYYYFWRKNKLKNSSFEEMTKLILASVSGSEGGYHKARYSLKVDKEKMHLYFVVGDPDFDFSVLKKHS